MSGHVTVKGGGTERDVELKGGCECCGTQGMRQCQLAPVQCASVCCVMSD